MEVVNELRASVQHSYFDIVTQVIASNIIGLALENLGLCSFKWYACHSAVTVLLFSFGNRECWLAHCVCNSLQATDGFTRTCCPED